MKKNRMMRSASALLVLTLLTTSVISGTFAKYTTAASATDTARVAKWGVVLQADGSLYGTKYLAADKNTATVDKTGITVAHDTTVDNKDLVAPGTKSDSGLNFKLTGTPEVSSKVTVDIVTQNVYLKAGTYGVMVPTSVVTAENFKTNTYYTASNGEYTLATAFANSIDYYTLEDKVVMEDDYYPVVYKLTGDTTNGTSASNTTYTEDSLNAVADAIVTAVKTGVTGTTDTNDASKTNYTVTSNVIDSNVAIESVVKFANENISWEWAFERETDCGKGNEFCVTCGADTILGNLMAGIKSGTVVKIDNNTIKAPMVVTDYCLDTTFDISIRVEQVD